MSYGISTFGPTTGAARMPITTNAVASEVRRINRGTLRGSYDYVIGAGASADGACRACARPRRCSGRCGQPGIAAEVAGRGYRKVTINPKHGASQEPAALRAAPRCGARTRSGSPCRSPIVNGENGAGCMVAQSAAALRRGGRNGNWKHGNYCGELRSALRLFRMVARIARQSRRETDTA
jgi:hypothetical protein